MMAKILPVTLAFIVMAWLVGGCASSETQVQQAAKDWCMTIRGSQVIPVYPLTEDIQPGDIFLVEVPVDQQQKLYERDGYLALDNHLARLNPDGYAAFYAHNFFPKGAASDLPADWVRPGGTNQSWQMAPHAAFPSYSFTVQNGAGLSLAVPVEGVPVGLSLLGSDAASGTVQIQDAHTVGVDTLSLYRQLADWAATNVTFLANYGTPDTAKDRNYVRIISRLYLTGRMTVSLKDASSRSGGLDVGAAKPINLLNPSLSGSSSNAPEANVQNFTNSFSALSQMVAAATSAKDAAGNVLPGGSLRLTAASSRSVSMDETFNPALTVGYLGFDCVIEPGGKLGPPIPTRANLDTSYAVKKLDTFRGQFNSYTNAFGVIETHFQAADADRRSAIQHKAVELGLLAATVDDTKFIKILRRVDASKPEIAAKVQQLADFAAQQP